MRKLSYILLVVAFCMCFFNGHAQTGNISSKSNIVKGELDNGLTYYLRSNPVSQKKASFYLVQKAGAILENDDQNGLAHFLEHMCFKGTKHFPQRELLTLLESKGLIRNMNAYTGITETIYYLKDMPTDDLEIFDKSLLILHDWCNYLSLDQEAIDSERPVIVEEMRTRRDLRWRLHEKSTLLTHNNSKYCKRNIVGTPEIILNFEREKLEQFYHDWYRTDLQAIVVIGDIDVIEMEMKIKSLFGKIPAVDNPKKIEDVIIEDHSETKYTQIEDKELTKGSIEICFRHPDDQSYSTLVKQGIVNGLFSQRINKMLEEDSLYLIDANISMGGMVKGYDKYSLKVTHNDNKASEALKLLLSLHKDVLENGFTQAEYDFVQGELEKSLSQYKKYSSMLPNQHFFDKVKANFLEDQDLLDEATELKIFKSTIKDWTNEDVKAFVKSLYGDKNKSIIVTCNGKDDQYLSKEEVEYLERESEV